MIGQYTVERRIRDLPEGYEFEPNRFIADKSDAGCYVTYKSQDGSVRYLEKHVYSTKAKVWFDSNKVIPCMIDFVPDTHRALWSELQKLGKCYLEYLSDEGDWQVSYPENHNWATKFSSNGDFNLTDRYGPSTAEAIENMIEEFFSCEIVHNGHRWFDCRDITNFKKISDDEARKVMGNVKYE